MRLLKKGAEADIYSTKWQGDVNAILKIRKAKDYRNQYLDSQIRRKRTMRESQMLCKVKSFGVPAPLVYFMNLQDASITMQNIPGTPVHDLNFSKIVSLSGQIGNLVGRLHKNGVMHGDLTTSNFILYQDTVFVIDFGLSQNTVRPEDHAVDLRLIREILGSAYARIMHDAWDNFVAGYQEIVGCAYTKTILRLVTMIESRGRYARVV